GIDVLHQLAETIYLATDQNYQSAVAAIKHTTHIPVSGPHPAGNESVIIHHTDPLAMHEKVWTIRPEDVVNIGLLFETGQYSAQRTVAVAGSAVGKPHYIKTKIGAQLSTLCEIAEVDTQQNLRYINGDVLTGRRTHQQGHLGFYNNLLSIIPEGNQYRMFGWMPFKDNGIPSLSKTSFAWLSNKAKAIDTNLNGEERALVVTGEMEKVFPMDIYPMQLLKACMIGDIEKMEWLGIYEVIPEDFGLIDFANTSKIEAQEIIKDAMYLMLKEVG
ncbi:MAG: NADH:ubiquinone reductase (Na(+)-transporting) subunit A, partial [Flavobacteriaceae bacterium]